jgi:hypothetical protein
MFEHKTLGLVKKILRQHHGGIYKRIDENRELLELLQRNAPDLLTKQPWIVNWLESQDEFLSDLEAAVPLADVSFPKRSSHSGHVFPRPWPLTKKA